MSRLSIDRGCLVCNIPQNPPRRLPLEDILAVIVAAKGISFSGECLSALLKHNAIILHCDHTYKPIGKTVGLHRVVHNELLDQQIFLDIPFMKEVWNKILLAKISNQAHLLDYMYTPHKLWDYIKSGNLDEGNAARHYWKFYFKKFGHSSPKVRNTRDAQDPVNSMLNYGYAVISSLCHRLLLVHGFNTSIGVYHRYRFRSDPLVYDIMEPLRPFCDAILLRFRQSNLRKKIDEWTKFAAKDIIFSKINIAGAKNLNFNFAVDQYISSFSTCFRTKSLENLYIPSLKDIYFDYEK
jgi:CRISPR-associated protein Cas1